MKRILLLASAASVGAFATGIIAGIGAAFAFTLFTGGAMPVFSALIALAGSVAMIGGSAKVMLFAWPRRAGEDFFELSFKDFEARHFDWGRG